MTQNYDDVTAQLEQAMKPAAPKIEQGTPALVTATPAPKVETQQNGTTQAAAPAQSNPPADAKPEEAVVAEPAKPQPGQPKAEEAPKTEVNTQTPAAPAITNTATLDDAAVLKYLKEKTGRADIDSLEELVKPKVLTQEEVEAQVEEKKERALQYGLNQKIFSQKDLKEYHIDSEKDAQEIAFKLFSEQQKKDNPSLTAEDIQERFDATFNLNAGDEWLKQDGINRMDGVKNYYLNQKYNKILGITNQYETYVGEAEKAISYKKTVDQAFSTLNKEFTHTIKDNDGKGNEVDKTYKFTYDDEVIEAVKKNVLTPDVYKAIGNGALDKTKIEAVISNALIAASLPKLLNSMMESYKSDALLTYAAGRQAVPHITAGPQVGAGAPSKQIDELSKAIGNLKAA